MYKHRNLIQAVIKKINSQCQCITCIDRRRKQRTAIRLGLFVIGITILAAIVTCAQTSSNVHTPGPNDPNPPTICLYHPSTLMKVDPAGRVHLIAARTFFWPQFVPAIPYIRQEWASSNQARQLEAISGAIQFSVNLSAQKIEDSKRVLIGHYLLDADQTNIPAISIYELMRQYIWSQNPAVRAWSGYWMIRVINSPSNGDCNPWRNYLGGQ